MKPRLFKLLGLALSMALLAGLSWSPMVASCGSSWHSELVDSASNMWFLPRLALDSDGHPHIAYEARLGPGDLDWDLKYAFHDGTAWHVETVHSEGRTGGPISLVLDPQERPHIAWRHYTSQSLMYGYHDGSTWHIENIASGVWPGWISMALDSHNHPHIAYYRDGAYSIMYTWHDGSSWHTEKVIGTGGFNFALALDSMDRPHLGLIDGWNHVVKYGWRDGIWYFETVYSDGQIGGEISLALDSSGQPHLAQVDISRNRLTYFWKYNGSWFSETVGSAVYAESWPHLKLDSLGQPHISYSDFEGTDLACKYAYRKGVEWHVETVAIGRQCSLALDAADAPHISYGDTSAGELRYAWREVTNEAPTADAGGPYLVAAGSSITLDGSASDPDADPLSYLWTAEAGSFDDPAQEDPVYIAGSEAGIFDLSFKVTDAGDLSATATTSVVVYDPEGGFVTGGGWIWSEAGWCQFDDLCARAEGKASFGFVSKYKKGATVPTGNTEFNFSAGGLNFHSSSYDWLVVTGSDYAKFKGAGTINGLQAPNDQDYKFMLWAGDGTGEDGADTFRIKIWWEEDGTEYVVYDNGTDQAIGGGNIVVHTKK